MRKLIETGYKHVVQKEGICGGRPIINGTRTSVSIVAIYHRMDYSPEEIHRALPHLSLAQIYDALSYYYDHKGEIEQEIKNDSEERVKTEFGS